MFCHLSQVSAKVYRSAKEEISAYFPKYFISRDIDPLCVPMVHSSHVRRSCSMQEINSLTTPLALPCHAPSGINCLKELLKISMAAAYSAQKKKREAPTDPRIRLTRQPCHAMQGTGVSVPNPSGATELRHRSPIRVIPGSQAATSVDTSIEVQMPRRCRRTPFRLRGAVLVQ